MTIIYTLAICALDIICQEKSACVKNNYGFDIEKYLTYYQEIRFAMVGILIFYLIIFMMPTCYLLYIQIGNIFLNLTSYERFVLEQKGF